jgi:hypothetical protein
MATKRINEDLLDVDIQDTLEFIFSSFSPEAFFVIQVQSNDMSVLHKVHQSVVSSLEMSSDILFLITANDVELVPLQGEFEQKQECGYIHVSKIASSQTPQSVILKIGNDEKPATSTEIQKASCIAKHILSQTAIHAIIVPSQLLREENGLYAIDPSFPSSTKNLFEQDR